MPIKSTKISSSRTNRFNARKRKSLTLSTMISETAKIISGKYDTSNDDIYTNSERISLTSLNK